MGIQAIIYAVMGVTILILMAYVRYLTLRIKDYEEAYRIKRKSQIEQVQAIEELHKEGPERLGEWFDSASWCVLPRVLMQNMSPAWQYQMAGLLNRLDKEFPASPVAKENLELTVTAKRNGKFVKLPDALTDYRRPKPHILQTWRQG